MNFLTWLGFKKVMDDTDPKNVIKFPEARAVPPMPEVVPPKEDVSTKPCYQIGKTAEGRVTLRLGTDQQWTSITMNNDGVDTLIRILEAAKEPETDNYNETE